MCAQVEYKYVILEEQDWTQQVNELSEGKVEYTYRMEPDSRCAAEGWVCVLPVFGFFLCGSPAAWSPTPGAGASAAVFCTLCLWRQRRLVQQMVPVGPAAAWQRWLVWLVWRPACANRLRHRSLPFPVSALPLCSPPDVQKITKQMAIVAWQPGPNRLLQVPTEDELAQLQPGVKIERVPQPQQQSSQRSYGQQAVGKLLGGGGPEGGGGAPPPGGAAQPPSSPSDQQRQEELSGIWEVLTLDDDGRPFLDRCAWLLPPSRAPPSRVRCCCGMDARSQHARDLADVPLPPGPALPRCRRDVWGREDQPRRSVRRPLFGR